jgi:hypothetical protein
MRKGNKGTKWITEIIKVKNEGKGEIFLAEI